MTTRTLIQIICDDERCTNTATWIPETRQASHWAARAYAHAAGWAIRRSPKYGDPATSAKGPDFCPDCRSRLGLN